MSASVFLIFEKSAWIPPIQQRFGPLTRQKCHSPRDPPRPNCQCLLHLRLVLREGRGGLGYQELSAAEMRNNYLGCRMQGASWECRKPEFVH